MEEKRTLSLSFFLKAAFVFFDLIWEIPERI